MAIHNYRVACQIHNICLDNDEVNAPFSIAKDLVRDQGYNATKVNCSFVYSVYILKPVLSGQNL